MKRKAQIQMGESIAIIIIVLILIIFTFIFYGKIKASDISEKKSLFEEVDVVKLSQIIYSLPEIQCSFAKVPDYGCVDLLKVKYLEELINDSQKSGGANPKIFFYYRELFGNSKITVQMIDIETEELTNIKLYETNQTWTSKNTVFMPLIVHNPITEFDSFGVMIVEKYSQ
ncbi:hypothetical protein ACFLTH_12545 [Bacteroidota bacterium]